MASVHLQIKGMSCGHCVSAVNKAMKGLNGVTDAKVEVGSAVVTYDPAKVSVDKMKEAVNRGTTSWEPPEQRRMVGGARSFSLCSALGDPKERPLAAPCVYESLKPLRP